MGLDGDLKPSPRNRRGRYVSAQQRIPVKDYEKSIGRLVEDFLPYIELDRQGVLEETGWPAYTIFRPFTLKKSCTPADNAQRIKIDLKQKIERIYLTSDASGRERPF